MTTITNTNRKQQTRNQLQVIRETTWQRLRKQPVNIVEIKRARDKWNTYKTAKITKSYYILLVLNVNGDRHQTERYATETEEYAKRIANTLHKRMHGRTLYSIFEVPSGDQFQTKLTAQAERTTN